MRTWGRLGAVALTVAVMVSGLLVMTAGPAAACTCAMVRSEAERMARADAVFVGELIGSRVDPSASPRETRRIPYRAPVVLTFKVSRVYKGAVGERQEIVTPGGGDGGLRRVRDRAARHGAVHGVRIQLGRLHVPARNLASTPRTCAADHGR